MFNKSLIEKLQTIETPFYYYDLELLKNTIAAVKAEADKYNFHIHYALKANANEQLLKIICKAGFGADCVSGNEVKAALKNNFNPSSIVFAGVGKTDKEITESLVSDIFCFNCESIEEIKVINDLASSLNKKARIALRINPNVNANTHHYITTGLEENKFGINFWELESVMDEIKNSSNIDLIGLHFHIGSQICDLEPFRLLCTRVNEIQHWFETRNISIAHLNVGGGLGVNYHEPDKNAVPDFKSYFEVFNKFLDIKKHQQVHFELGRSIVSQCVVLISKVLFIKKGKKTNFIILDAGMTELIRPALYQSYHKIENLTAEFLSFERDKVETNYDVAGPICESSDCFAKSYLLPESKRGDLIALRTTGAYGQVMSLEYNLRERAKAIYSDGI